MTDSNFDVVVVVDDNNNIISNPSPPLAVVVVTESNTTTTTETAAAATVETTVGVGISGSTDGNENNNNNNNSNFRNKTPFDWLQGGLFFGNNSSIRNNQNNNSNNNNNKTGSGSGGSNNNKTNHNNNNNHHNMITTIESIESCTDVLALLTGVAENLQVIIMTNEACASSSSSFRTATTSTTNHHHNITTNVSEPNDNKGIQQQQQQHNYESPLDVVKEMTDVIGLSVPVRSFDGGVGSGGSYSTCNTVGDATTTIPSLLSSDSSSDNCEVSKKLIAARLSRLRFLLYDERRITSQQYQSYHYSTGSSNSNTHNNHHQTGNSGNRNNNSGGGINQWVMNNLNMNQQQQQHSMKNNPRSTTTIPPLVAGTTIQCLTGVPIFSTTTNTNTTATNTSTSSNATVDGSGSVIIQQQELIPKLLHSMIYLPFESRKHVTAIINYLLVCGLDGYDSFLYDHIMTIFVQYIQCHYETIMTIIVNGHHITTSSTRTSSHSNLSIIENTDTNSTNTEQQQQQQSLEESSIQPVQVVPAAIATTTPTIITSPDIGLHFGSLYRSCLRHYLLYKELVGTSERVKKFVLPFLDIYVHIPHFEISSDAMESIRVVFNAITPSTTTTGGNPPTGGPNNNPSNGNNNNNDNNHHQQQRSQHPPPEDTMKMIAQLASEFLYRDYEMIWDERYNIKLLSSDHANYMTRRVALQILSTILLTRSNYNIMMKYVTSRSNLILVMKLLRESSPHITLDAFHVFKVFVANPNKPNEIIKILKDNQMKLCKYLQTLHLDKEMIDTQFRDEKELIIATIEGL